MLIEGQVKVGDLSVICEGTREVGPTYRRWRFGAYVTMKRRYRVLDHLLGLCQVVRGSLLRPRSSAPMLKIPCLKAH